MSEYGSFEERDGRTYLRFERRFAHPVEKVWAALTDPDRVVKWWAEQKTLELREGGAIRMAWTNGGPDTSGVVTRVEPPHLLEHTLDWSEAGSAVQFSWRLQPTEDGGTLLRLEHAVVGRPLRRELSGWATHLELLERHLDGKPSDFSMEHWREVDARVARHHPDLETAEVPDEIARG
jgi:uncharacterized protein YndB with AHSA1/START domain